MIGAMKPELLLLFLFFSVPGIVALFFRAQFMAGRMPKVGEGLLSYVTVSLAYHALVFPLTARLYAAASLAGWHWAGWVSLIFLGPALVGILLGLNIRKGWARKMIGRFGISTIHPVTCAWDWRFSQCEEGWVIATLKNGTQWHGYMGVNSFMSSDPGERDILIEQVYDSAGEGASWTPRGSAVWIANGEIQSLEFLPRNQGG